MIGSLTLRCVAILVLVEVLITLGTKQGKSEWNLVAILVLVEVLITQQLGMLLDEEERSRNPCFSGSSNHTSRLRTATWSSVSRNPCFSGSSNHTGSAAGNGG